jgi:hypothetical protein
MTRVIIRYFLSILQGAFGNLKSKFGLIEI